MLEKEYLICFNVCYASGEGRVCDAFYKTSEKMNSKLLKIMREELKEAFRCDEVIFTNVVCLGEVEDE